MQRTQRSQSRRGKRQDQCLLPHCDVAGFHVAPPSEVTKAFLFARFQMVALRPSVARTPPKSSSSGEWTVAQCAPASVVSRMVAARPTTQHTLSEGAEPAVKSTRTLLICRDHEAPASLENSIIPVWPARHRTLFPGAGIKWGLTASASRREASSLKAAAGAGTGGAGIAG